MERIPRRRPPSSPPRLRSSFSSSSMAFPIFFNSLFLFYLFATAYSAPSKLDDTFTPKDNYLLDCGSSSETTLPDKRKFMSDQDSTKLFNHAGREIQVSEPSAKDVSNPIYLNAKVFVSEATYSFQVSQPGWHWIRLHFFPVSNNEFKLQESKFSITCDELVLLHDFSVSENKCVMKEYLVNVTHERFAIKFTPTGTPYAFVNAIEFVSAPDMLISDAASFLFPVETFKGLSSYSYMTVYRLNMGGPLITPENDALGRSWEPDHRFVKVGAENVSVAPNVVNYPQGTSVLIGPRKMYSTAVQMADAGISGANFNITWSFEINTAFTYLVRLHFCDIVSKSMNELYFNVYVGGKMAISGLDLSTLTGELASAYYKDIVVNSSLVTNPLNVQIGPMNQGNGARNAILNGLEILKVNNSVNSLDGEVGAGNGPQKETVAAVGFAMMFGAFVGLGAMAVKWQKRPNDWDQKNSFSSWLLPLHSRDSSYVSKNSSDSRKSTRHSSAGLGRFFTVAGLTEATKNWDSNAIIGVGGFGNVYVGEIDDGIKVAVKRGNPQSEQGINEFQTEIQMLSKLRHRHLVSLIGYCDENSEMILVYEYMSNGPLRDHLYGDGNLPSLSWKQRLEICIGAARGLHYLHTGSSRGIIHRDVKSTNILLDDNFVAKMADFGLSKDAGPIDEGGQTHVSTAVKGSFGYLDPEYFRKQQLTDKSDVYSFGVVLLEVLCARAAINPALPRDQVNLAEWALKWKRKGQIDKIIDPTLAGNINQESLTKFVDTAENCLSDYGVDRPTMGDVLWNLESALHLQEGSLEGKSDEENKGYGRAPPSPSPGRAPKPAPVPAPTQPVNEHSGTATFTQFTELNGR